MEFPPAVRLYVQRCFAPENQVASVSHPEMQEKLRQVITEAAENDKLHMMDWERLALPQVMIQNERNRILANPSVSKWGMSGQPSSPSDASRKRKSTESSQLQQSEKDSPPWKKTNNRSRFEDRITHPSTEKKLSRMTLDDSSKSKANLEMRRRRFEGAGVSYGTSGTSSPVDSPSSRSSDQDQGPVVGRCQTLEKNYFRLTSAPNPDTVRPLPVLQKALDLLKKKWKQEANYTYISGMSSRSLSTRFTRGLPWRRGILVSIISVRLSFVFCTGRSWVGIRRSSRRIVFSISFTPGIGRP
jgi:hypothetical protein